MRRIYSSIIAVLLITFVATLSSSSVFAYHVHAVLGSSTQQLSMPPTVEGPGLILPDSPFYFLDQLKQQVRIALAVTPEMKAVVYTQIAGERFAETRFELAKGNLSAAEVALDGVRQNTRFAAQNLAEAKFEGVNDPKVASVINLSIKQHQQVLDTLSLQSSGEVKAEVDVVNATLSDAKDSVENSLSTADLTNEIRDDLNRDVTRLAINTSDSAKDLQATLSLLQKEASTAAMNNQTQRAQALQVVIAEKTTEAQQLASQPVQKQSYALQPQAAVAAAEIVTSAENFAKAVSPRQK